MTAARAYTFTDLERMRAAVEFILHKSGRVGSGQAFEIAIGDLCHDRIVEDRVRTYVLGGIEPVTLEMEARRVSLMRQEKMALVLRSVGVYSESEPVEFTPYSDGDVTA